MITKGKKALLAALLFALLLISFALGAISGMSSRKTGNGTDIEFYTDSSSYPSGAESITLIVSNRSGASFKYDKKFELERLSGDRWGDIEFNDVGFVDYAADSVLYPLSTCEWNLEIGSMAGGLGSGKYRIKKLFFDPHDESRVLERIAEFSIAMP
jgi:hypothetical protein